MWSFWKRAQDNDNGLFSIDVSNFTEEKVNIIYHFFIDQLKDRDMPTEEKIKRVREEGGVFKDIAEILGDIKSKIGEEKC